MINGKVEDRLCGLGPPFYFYIEEDYKLQDLKEEIFHIIEEAYSAVDVYAERFESIRKFYAEDCAMVAETIKEERGIIESI